MKLFLGESFDPWHNLAVEDVLFSMPAGDEMYLYLWQNKNTVVIGRHQNVFKECRTALLEAEDGKLARRTTGGGAVFHDLGNLNFTFITRKVNYNLERQLGVIIAAAGALGIAAGFTGRNDIVASNGAKFSGNAFRFSNEYGMHHGTLLINADMNKLGRYLAPSPDKLKAKGVDSVRARVCNLKDISPDITVDMMKNALIAAFEREYGHFEQIYETQLDKDALNAAQARLSSEQWRYGLAKTCDARLETRFSWGGVEAELSVVGARIESARVYSDAMDELFIQNLEKALCGVKYEPKAMADAARAVACGDGENADVANWFLSRGE